MPLPDSVRRQLDPILKHHFWILATLVPLILLPALFMAAADRRQAIEREKIAVDGKVSALNAVRNEPDHPNAAWSEAIDRQTIQTREELLREWQAFWNSQGELREWPQSLGPEFLTAINALESGTRRELQFRDLQRYQNAVQDIVRKLPARMGCEEAMTDADDGTGLVRPRDRGDAAQGGGDEAADPEASRPRPILAWSENDQRELLKSFTWEKPPSTTQVLLAQEELWVYGLFCDVIRRINKDATAHFDSRITTVEELAVGYPAAEDTPGGAGTGRVLASRDTATGGLPPGFTDQGGPPPEAGLDVPPQPTEQPPGRPFHPRFPGFPGAVGGPDQGPPGIAPPATGVPGDAEGERRATVSPDDMLRQWIYVDFSGRPLTTAELQTVADARLVHLMPFTLRVVIDQRQVDRLLTELAGSRVPIDVRQVRVNPSTQFGGDPQFGSAGGVPPFPGGGGGGFPGEGGAGGGKPRPFDVTLELRGTVGLATRPNPAVFGPAGGATDAPGGGT